jgi:cytochrome c oxidase subunit III
MANQLSSSRTRVIAGVCALGMALAFLASQLWAWKSLGALGYDLAGNPANSFFYMMTALHALHLVGGLFAWVRTNALARGEELQRLDLNVTLCAIYWHFLLVVWLVLFGVLLLFS